MANTKILIFYLMVLVFFGTLSGFVSTDSQEFELSNYLKISELRNELKSNEDIFSSLISYVLIPFIIIDFIVGLIAILGFGFSSLPSIINIILFTPLSLIIIFDYVLPMIRGN